MKNKLLTKGILLCLAFALAISATGCKSSKNDNITSSVNSSTQANSSESSETVDVDDPDDSNYDEEYPEDDNWGEEGEYFPEDPVEELPEEPGEDLPEEPGDDEEYYFIENVKVSNGSKPVENDFLGFNTVYHCYTYINDKMGRNYTEEQAQLEFDRLANMGVDIVRTYYNEEYAYNKEDGSWNWESDDMKAVYKWMKEMQKRNISIACNSGWSIKGAYEKDNYAAWLGCYVEGDLETTAKNHANWFIKSLNQFRAHGINNIDYVILFTEPAGVSAYNAPSEVLSMYLEDTYDVDPNVERWLVCSRAIHDALVKDGTRNLYKLVGPNNDDKLETKGLKSKNGAYNYMHPLYYFALKYASDFIDVYSTHTYPQTTSVENDTIGLYMDSEFQMQDNIDAARDLGKKFWYDETNVRCGGWGVNNLWNASSNDASEGLHAVSYFANTMNRGVQSVLWWYIFDQQWPNNNTNNNDDFINGLHACGCIPSLMVSYIPQKAYYANSLLTKYFGNHATVYKAEAEFEYFNCGVQKDENGNWSICIANIEIDPGYAVIEFEKNIGKQKFYRHVYKASDIVATAEAEILPADKILTTKGDRIIDRIEPMSVVVYTTVAD